MEGIRKFDIDSTSCYLCLVSVCWLNGVSHFWHHFYLHQSELLNPVLSHFVAWTVKSFNQMHVYWMLSSWDGHFRCGKCWYDGNSSQTCRECGGFPLQRPCPICDGRCKKIWTRNVKSVRTVIELNKTPCWALGPLSSFISMFCIPFLTHLGFF